jgi:EmrB/QacA subfamily drug resistance transporter
MSNSTASADAAAPALELARASDPRRWLALAVLMVGGFMDLLDTTIVNVAVPSIQHHLHATSSGVEWIVAAYSLAYGSMLITGGRLGDIVGRKRMFLLGVMLFTASSALAGVAQTQGVLISARVLEGIGAAVMTTQVLSIIQAEFAPDERAAVFGMYGGISGLAAVAGPILGGVLVNADLFGRGWRTVFLINVPVGLCALVAAKVLVRESRSEHPLRLDAIGAVLSTAAMLLLTYPLIQGRQDGWPAWSFIMLGTSVLVFVVFVIYERYKTRRNDSPLIALGLFAQRTFVSGMAVEATYYAGIGSLFIVFTLTVQAGLHYSALHAGLTLLPWSLGAMFGAGASVRLAARAGRILIVVGAALSALGALAALWVAHHAGVKMTTLDLAAPFAVGGLGMGLLLPPIVDVTLAGVDPNDAGSASGILNTTQQIGSVIGVAFIGIVFFHLIARTYTPQSYTHALTTSLWVAVAAFSLSALAALFLPQTSRETPDGKRETL